MKKTKPSRVSIRDIARASGNSPSHVSYALQNRPSVKKATRDRILRIARRLGYVPDARLASWMSSVREAKAKDLLPIAWLNTNEEKDAWRKYKFMSPCIEGAQERALQLGYRLDELWLHEPGMSMARINRILYQRGIEGVIVTPPAKHIRFDWNHLAGVSIGGDLFAPRLHRVDADIFYNLLLALKMVKRFGYRRIGVCLSESFDRYSHHSSRAAARYFQETTPRVARVPALFYASDDEPHRLAAQKQIAAWLARHRPDVIICHNNQMLAWVKEAGYRVPKDIGIVHLATDDDVSDWAGISSNRREEGALAVELIVSLMQSRQFGVPKVDRNTSIRGTWHPGRTLLIPRSA